VADPASLFDYLSDAVERKFLVTALSRTLTDAERERYAAALAERDPKRAEWLRLELELHARAADDPETRLRFDTLCRTLQGDWVRLLRRDTLLNCGRALDKRPRVRFAFVCSRRWESLAPTDDPRVRACDSCQQRVYHCGSVSEAEARARDGECIAVPGELVATIDGYDARQVLGRPDPIGRWAERLFGDE
jgi:hypothetical protein